MKPIWTPNPESISKTNMESFRNLVEEKYSIQLSSYNDLWNWSVENVEDFWRLWVNESGLIFHKTPGGKKEDILKRGEHFSQSKWFPNARLNFAENLLRKMDEDSDRIAISFQPESGTVPPRSITRKELLKEVIRVSRYLQSIGIQKGDRIAAVLPNSPESIIAMLAVTSLGAIWSSASPDFGVKGILDRFQQIDPKILIVSNGYFFKGKEINCMDKWQDILSQLNSVRNCIVWNFTQPDSDLNIGKISTNNSNTSSIQDKMIDWKDIQEANLDSSISLLSQMKFESIGFQDPVYIMYSSGTTGLPKCIVQGSGVLINHTKELILHSDLKEEESISYYTTCGWMMWNWVASSLFVGSKLCIYDGNPFYPDSKFLWEWIEKEKINVFGTSAKYLTVLQQEPLTIKNEFSLESLRCILSTGSPLPESGFRFVYQTIKSNLQLSSISGGTDLNGCFALGNPVLPVYEGEIQCRGLGMDVDIFNEDGNPIKQERGELVCKTPFPSMPLFFWKDYTGEKYMNAYFSTFSNIWCHGDFAEITSNDGVVIYGRSDATLNPGGVRIGTADIYNILETIPFIEDSVIIGQTWDNDVQIVLFVKLVAGFELDEDKKSAIKKSIRESASPRHVPAIIHSVSEIPYTVNGKKVELAIKNISEGREVKNANSLANPSCLDEYKLFFENQSKK